MVDKKGNDLKGYSKPILSVHGPVKKLTWGQSGSYSEGQSGMPQKTPPNP